MSDSQMPEAAGEIAARLVEARRSGTPLMTFPGTLPETLEAAYAIQDAGIALWGDAVAGWKIGLVPPAFRASLGADRMVGPVFGRSVMNDAGNGAVTFPVFVGGFAAVEAEVIFRIGADAPAGKTVWSLDEAAALVESAHIGVETAGSPLAPINDIGPMAVVPDFGNNAGVIVGAAIEDWRGRLADLTAATVIDGGKVGEGRAMGLPGGPLEGLRYLASLLGSRGQPLRAGQLVSSGAITGVHDILAGQTADVVFPGCGELRCSAVPF